MQSVISLRSRIGDVVTIPRKHGRQSSMGRIADVYSTPLGMFYKVYVPTSYNNDLIPVLTRFWILGAKEVIEAQ